MVNHNAAPPRKIQGQTLDVLASEWDAVAEQRNFELRSGLDLSYKYVLKPGIWQLAAKADWSRVLDCGCGTGVFAEELSSKAGDVVGIDISGKSIAIAQQHSTSKPRLRFVQSTVEDLARTNAACSFTLAIANMTLMVMPGLTTGLQAIADLLVPGGEFVASITHPCFWPQYWGYAQEDWFNYNNEIFIQAPLKISLGTLPSGLTTHIHRPLSLYFATLRQVGFRIKALDEPLPPSDVQDQYPQKWQFPRFLLFACVRTRLIDSR